MRKVGSRELKNRLGAYLARATRGEVILITDRGKPVALLSPVPIEPPARTLEDLLHELAVQGHIRLATRPFKPVKPIRAKGKLLSEMISEDRE